MTPVHAGHPVCAPGKNHGLGNPITRKPPDSLGAGGRKGCASQSNPYVLDGCQVLLVQHRPIELKAMAQMLAILGYRVTRAEDSGKALLYFRKKGHHLVVSDFDLPQFNGYMLAREIRRHAPGTRIVLITARCQAEVAVYMNYQIVDGWLFKPFRLGVLRDMIKHVSYSQQEVEWISSNSLQAVSNSLLKNAELNSGALKIQSST